MALSDQPSHIASISERKEARYGLTHLGRDRAGHKGVERMPFQRFSLSSKIQAQ